MCAKHCKTARIFSFSCIRSDINEKRWSFKFICSDHIEFYQTNFLNIFIYESLILLSTVYDVYSFSKHTHLSDHCLEFSLFSTDLQN